MTESLSQTLFMMTTILLPWIINLYYGFASLKVVIVLKTVTDLRNTQLYFCYY